MTSRHDILYRLKSRPFAGRISDAQAAGCGFLIDAWEAAPPQPGPEPLAYVLATAFHETGGAMQPLRERGGPEYLRRRYDVTGRDPERARAHGNTEPGDGIRYAGRGFVQLTWKANYQRAGARLGIDLAGDPDRALEPRLAAAILIEGMAQGWFTGKRLADFIRPGRADFVQARRIVNGLDRAELVAGHARDFLRALAPAVSLRAPPRPLPLRQPSPPAHP